MLLSRHPEGEQVRSLPGPCQICQETLLYPHHLCILYQLNVCPSHPHVHISPHGIVPLHQPPIQEETLQYDCFSLINHLGNHVPFASTDQVQ